MNAMVLTNVRRLEMRELPEPDAVQAGELRLKVKSVGICGSDVHYYSNGRIGSVPVEYPHIMGHEFSGVVEEAGSDVAGFEIGELVAVDPAISCGECAQCLAGRPNTCATICFLSCPGEADGCLAETVVVPAANCFRTALSPEEAALAEPLSIGVYAAQRVAQQLPSANIAIQGAGPIGLGVLAASRSLGATRRYVSDPLAYRREAAGRLEAEWTGAPEALDALVDNDMQGLFDIVIECCGQQDALDQAMRILKPGGCLLIVGIPEGQRTSFSTDLMRRKEITIRNVRRQIDCMQPALELLANGSSAYSSLVTHRYAFDETPAAFETVAQYRDGVIKAMVEIA
jgi:L-iditol 2-dehydrogenase